MSVALRFSLFKHSNGVYYVIYRENGRRRWKSTGATVKTDALRELTRLKELLQERGRSISLARFVDEFKAWGQSNHSPKTTALFKAVLGRFLSMFPGAFLSYLTPQHVDKFKAKRLKEVKPVSVNVDLRMLKAAFNKARSWKLIDSDLFNGITLAQLPEQTPPYFSRAEFQTLLNTIRPQWLREMVLFAVLTGMRRGEIVNLKWSQVDLQKPIVTVESSENFRTKQGKRRVIPLGEAARTVLQSKIGKSHCEYVFTLNDAKVYDNWVTHAFKKAVKDAKLDTRLHFHSLRHTFASWLVQDGVSLFEVQKLLGHSSSSVTEIYSHLQPEQMHSTVNRIDVPLN